MNYAQASINFSKFWNLPCILIEADLALKKDEAAKSNQQGFYFHEPAEPKLRAIHVNVSNTAREKNFIIHYNMRIPERSVISEVFYGKIDFAEAEEDLCWWESNGRKLLPCGIKVLAKRLGKSVNAMIVPVI